MLMGGGGSFSAGGPGKGMHSWLYLEILNKYGQFQSCTAFTSIFNNTGVFGIYGCIRPDYAAPGIELVADQIKAVTTRIVHVHRTNLARAKAATKSAILMNLESRMIAAEDRKPVDQFLEVVDQVTLMDISDFTEKLIAKPLTMASIGEVLNVPSYDSVSRMFSRR